MKAAGLDDAEEPQVARARVEDERRSMAPAGDMKSPTMARTVETADPLPTQPDHPSLPLLDSESNSTESRALS